MNHAKNVTLPEVLAFIRMSDRDVRRELNREIVALLDAENAAARANFKYGDKVKFTVNKRPYYGREFVGTVIKRNPKTIEVRVADGAFGQTWKVSPSMLSRA